MKWSPFGVAEMGLVLIVGICPQLSLGKAKIVNFEKANWTLHSEKDGIRVSTWSPPKTFTHAFKVTAEVRAPIAKVAQIIADTQKTPDWMPNVDQAKDVLFLENGDRIGYYEIGTPIFVADREALLRVHASYSRKKKTLTYRFKSAEDRFYPKKKHIRTQVYASHYVLRQTKNGEATVVTLIVHMDPMGSVPKWIVNLFQTSYPKAVIKALRKRVRDPEIIPNSTAEALLRGERVPLRGLLNTSPRHRKIATH